MRGNPSRSRSAKVVERYEIDILQGGNVLRTLHATDAKVTYPADQELADFGSPQSVLRLRVVQMSSVAGRGFESVDAVAVAPGV